MQRRRGYEQRSGSSSWNGEEPPAYYKRPDVELYDLRDDPGERRNLASERPNMVKRLRAQLYE